MAHILEAKCNKCGETFVPYSENDLEHIWNEQGQLCEGQGELLGEYHNPSTPHPANFSAWSPEPWELQ